MQKSRSRKGIKKKKSGKRKGQGLRNYFFPQKILYRKKFLMYNSKKRKNGYEIYD